MKNYQCKKCRTHLTNNSTPRISNCPSGGSHSWSNLGEAGSVNYQCKKCAVLVQSKRTPSISGCPSGGSHSWNKL